jgi:hypothetical protein
VIADENLRIAVERHLQRRLDDETWDFATEQEWVAAAHDELVSDVLLSTVVEGLARRIRQLLVYRSAPRSTESREIPPDGRDDALARVLAALASRERSLTRFRREVLRGRLVDPSRVATWVRRRSEREGPPTLRRVVPVERSGTPLPTPYGFVEELPLYLDVWNEAGLPEGVQIREDGILWRLKKLCEWLTQEYSFAEPDGVSLVLSGRMPPAPRTRASWTSYPRLPARSFVCMEVNPRVSPREVGELYADVRVRLLQHLGLGSRSRPMTEEHAELAVFAVERESTSWEDLRLQWNENHPDREFVDVRRFIRDVRAAYRRVTGERLHWKGRG